MKKWKHRLDLSDIFHSEKLEFEEIRDIIVSRIKKSSFYEEVAAEKMDFEDAVKYLGEAESQRQFDFFWDDIYDYADAYDCWISTR